MLDPIIEDPMPGNLAFEQDDETAAWSRAAQIVGLGVQLAERSDLVWNDDARKLRFPKVDALSSPFSAEDVASYLLRSYPPFDWTLLRRFARGFGNYAPFATGTVPAEWPGVFRELERRLAPDLYRLIRRGHNPKLAASLLHVSQFSHHEIVRVAAAASLASLRTALTGPTIEILARGCTSRNDTVQQIAIDALLNIAPSHPALTELRESQEPETETGTDPAHTSVIVPGTGARLRRPSWWRPGERLFTYLQEEPGKSEPSDGTFVPVGHDLYARDNYYRWNTRLDTEGRVDGALALAKWAASHGCAAGFSKVFTHSHGGNVALLAAARHELDIELLVLMATPSHERTELEWAAINKHVKRIVSLRSRFDFVVVLDHVWSRTRDIPTTGSFPSDRVRTIPLPAWYGHFVLTRPDVWAKHHLAHEVAAEYEEATQ